MDDWDVPFRRTLQGQSSFLDELFLDLFSLNPRQIDFIDGHNHGDSKVIGDRDNLLRLWLDTISTGDNLC
jgi:hypothetical protein